MAILVTSSVQIARFANALYGVKLGSVTNAAVLEDVSVVGLASAVNSYYSSSFGSMTSAQVATVILGNLGLAGNAGAQAYVEGQLNAAGSAKGAAVLTMLNAFSNMTADATFGAAATAWNGKIVAALAYTASNTGDVTTDYSSPVTGDTFILSSGTNNFTGTTGDDSFDGSLSSSGAQTLQTSDSLNGGDGTDTLDATISGTSIYSPKLTSVEEVNIAFTGAATVSLANATGVTALAATSSSAAANFTNIGSTSVALSVNNTNQAATFGYASGVTTGTNTVAVGFDNVTAISANGPDVTIAGVEVLNITSSGSASDVDLIAASATTLNISGDAALTLNSLNADGSTAVVGVDASALTAALTVTADGLGTTAATVSITGGTGNDVIDVDGVSNVVNVNAGAGNDTVTAADNAADITTADVINGGDGTDTLNISAALTVGTATGISNFETLAITATGVTQDMDAFTASTITRVNSTVSGNTTSASFSDVSANVLTLGISGAAPDDVTLARKVDTSADSLSVLFTGTGTTFDSGDGILSLANEETLTISSGGTGANTIDTLTATDLISLTITGAQNLTITENITASAVTTIDASAATGAVSLSNSSSTANVTATAGAGGFTVTTGSGNDTIIGGAGNDTLAAGSGANSVNGAAGNDSLDGGSGNDTLIGGDGNDTLDADAGIDSLSGGEGNDTIQFSSADEYVTTSGSADTVNGGNGTDTVVLVTNDAQTPVFTSVEALEVEFTAAVALTMSSSTDVTTIKVSTGSTAGASLAAVNTGTTVNVYDADFATIDTAAGASITVNTRVDRSATLNITDAVSVTLATNDTAAGTEDFHAVALDDTDTTSLTVNGSSSSVAAVLTTGAISNTNALTTLSVNSRAAGATVSVGAISDADALTSLVVTGNYANITMDDIGGTATATGTAEALATITLTASNGATVDFDGEYINADLTNSTTDNAMTLTATSDATSTVETGSIRNTYGTIGATFSGAGVVNSDELRADDVTLYWSNSAASTITLVTATDDFVMTSSGAVDAADKTISTLTVGDDATITHTGSGDLTITTVTDGIGNLVIDASTASGAVLIGTNSATSTTEGASLTGGSGNDSLEGAAANDYIDGGSGNDVILGGDLDDTLIGGAGNDSITAGSGDDSITGGDGNDTIILSTNWTSDDEIDGGAGTTDTVTISVTTTIAPTLTNVEYATVAFTTGGAFNAGNSSSLTRITVNEAADNTAANAVVVNIATGTNVILAEAATALNISDLGTVTLDTAANASLTVTVREATGSALTITDASAVTINASSTATTSSVANLVLDDTDTSTLAVTGAAGAYTLATGNITGTNALTGVTVTTSTASGTATLGTIADVDALTSITVNAVNANATIGQIATDATANNSELLSTVTVTATGSATAQLGQIYADSTVDSTSDLAMTVSGTADSGSTVSFLGIDNTYGSIGVTIAGAGNFNVGNVTTALAAVTATINAADATGTNVINTTLVSTSASITLASGNGADTLVVGDTNMGLVSVTNFETGSGEDQFELDISQIGTIITWTGATTKGDATAGTSIQIEEVSAAETAGSGDNVFVLTGAYYATADLAEAAIENGGDREINFGAAIEVNDEIIVVWSDGSNSYVGAWTSSSTSHTNPAGALTVIAELVGVDVSVSGTLNASNFDFVS